MESTLTHLEGSRSGARYDADILQRLDPVDGAPLLARYDLERAARTLNPRSLAARPGPGMWRWSELLPVRNAANRVHLGEGATPLLAVDRLGAALGLDRLRVKAEGLNPTGSFKARGMAAAVSRAKELGARSLIAPSAGNAGGALAAYGAAAGLPVTIVVPADTPEVNVVEAQMCGARVILVEGFISDCGHVAAAVAAMTGAFDVSTLKEPYRVEGKKTMGLELVEQLTWGVPDVIVYPTGGGTGLVGMWKAFEELEVLGLLGSARPRMVSVQAAGCAPIVRAFAEGAETARPWANPSTRASGLRVPGAVGDRLILSCLRESEGTAVAVPEAEIDALQRLAGRRGAGYVSPETAAAFAAVASLADDGWLAANDRVVVFDTGIGQKYPPPADLPTPPTVDPTIAGDPERLEDLLELRPRVRVPVPEPAVPDAPTAAADVPEQMPPAPRSLMPEARTRRVLSPGSRRLQGLMSRRVAERRMVMQVPRPDDLSTTPPPGDAPTAAEEPTPTPTSTPTPSAPARRVPADPLRITGVGRPRVPGEAPGDVLPVADGPRVPGTGAVAVPVAPTAEVALVPAPPAPMTEEPADELAQADQTRRFSLDLVLGQRDEGAAQPVGPLPRPPYREIVVHPLPAPPHDA